MLQSPSQREVGHRPAKLFGNLSQLPNLFDHCLPFGRVEVLDALIPSTSGVEVESRALRDPIIVFTGKGTATKGAEDRAAGDGKRREQVIRAGRTFRTPRIAREARTHSQTCLA